jgi:hypothetical protein
MTVPKSAALLVAGIASLLVGGAGAVGAMPVRHGAEATGKTLPQAPVHRVAARPVHKAATKVQSRPAAAPTTAAASLPLTTIVQTLNNCGPASIAEVLAYWHVYRTQGQVQAVVRGDNNPHGMAPYGVPVYTRSVGLRTLLGAAGSDRLIKALLSNGFPVIVSQWVSAGDQIRHYRPIQAYNDRLSQFVSSDPYLGPGHVISYAEFNAIWSVSDNRFMVIYPPSRQARLQAVLRAAGWNARTAYAHELAWQQARMRQPSSQLPGGWLRQNSYAALAWDEAELGRYSRAAADLTTALKMGASPLMVGWVRHDIQLLRRNQL